ncbi:hypothetical protein LGT39_11290 [Demequina sp. TTPB684]|uniref:hypothetical protein n=1 Tax=unclassified Demequina TaxID=2620311 RepID=UPI001CF1BA1C|nr:MULTISPECIES: hypothetical protein [unclassified Demequina]MCB2413428.1 hypothetical protein [Demequina sp. TTPB684]UPU87991.1 hypothetical protein LGT36_012180 [Demequina sp. TMPB413]
MDDFRDLMTAQMDDAAARFADEDFAALYGGAVVSRVRRRRTVRAAGVGGGTMLTAGALALAVTQLPANRAMNPASGGPCVTITPSVTESRQLETQADGGSWVLMDSSTGEIIVSAEFQADGAWLVTHASGLTEVAEVSPAGTLVIAMDDGGVVTLAVPADNDIVEGSFVAPPAEEGATGEPKTVTSGDCVTESPLPTPSALEERPSATAAPSPTVAARVEDITSPFQCGFEFPVPEYATEQLSIAVEPVSNQEIGAELNRRFGAGAPASEVEAGNGMWATITGMPGGSGAIVTETSVLDPLDPGRTYVAGRQWTERFIAEGVSVVGTRDGTVVTTVVPEESGLTPGFISDRVREGADLEAFVFDRTALIACDVDVDLNVDSLSYYLVAGYAIGDGSTVSEPIYAWQEAPAPVFGADVKP